MMNFLNCPSGGQISNTKNEHCEAIHDANIINEEYAKYFSGMVVSFNSTDNELCLFNGIPFAVVTNDAKIYKLGFNEEHSVSVAISKCGRRYGKTLQTDIKLGDLLGINADGYFEAVTEPSLAHAKACGSSFKDTNSNDDSIYLVDVEFDFTLPRGMLVERNIGRKLSEAFSKNKTSTPANFQENNKKMQEILKENEKLRQEKIALQNELEENEKLKKTEQPSQQTNSNNNTNRK